MKAFKRLLGEANYDHNKTNILINGFSTGFDIGYRGPMKRRDKSKNLPFHIGDKVELWNKVMKEVLAGRYAGPFQDPPFDWYVQSPIGLVSKAGNKTRLIFHLSYDFGPELHQKSVNYHTPDELCSVKYNDLDHAVKNCLNILRNSNNPGTVLYFGISDCSNAFRIVPTKPHQRALLVM